MFTKQDYSPTNILKSLAGALFNDPEPDLECKEDDDSANLSSEEDSGHTIARVAQIPHATPNLSNTNANQNLSNSNRNNVEMSSNFLSSNPDDSSYIAVVKGGREKQADDSIPLNTVHEPSSGDLICSEDDEENNSEKT